MKKDKNSLKQKIVIAIACLVIVACTISMTTMAWFTDTMQGTTNLTFGKIKLSDDFTEYTFNTPETPAVASRKINNGDWTIVLDETSNDAFIRLIAKYGAPVSYTLTTDSTYLPNKAYYKVVDTDYVKMVEGDEVGADYEVGDDITSPNSTVYECNYSLAYIANTVSTLDNVTLAKIAAEKFTTQYYPVVSAGVLGSNFLKGVKYYAFVGGQFRALIGSTTYDANTDYYYGQAYSEFGHEGDHDNDPLTPDEFIADTVYVAYNYSTSGVTATHKIVAVPDTTYSQLVETNDSATIGIAANSVVGAGADNYRYTIYNAYIDWLIENVTLPGTPEAVGHYFKETIEDEDLNSETYGQMIGDVEAQGDYAFIKSATTQGTAVYYLASALPQEGNAPALNAVRTDEDGITYNYTFVKDDVNDIKIADSADQITLKSATLTEIANSTALSAAYAANNTGVLKLVDGFYTIYNGTDAYAENTYYTYTGDVTVINRHVYFLSVAANATPLVLKYAQKDLGLGMSVDIQAIQTILSRKATSDDVTAGLATAVGDKLTIAIIVSTDTVATGSSLVPANEAGKLGAYLNGKVVRVATIADIAPYFKAQFDRPAN